LAKGAKINEREKLRGTTALMWAAANSNADAVRVLISRGAEINSRSGTVAPGRRPYLAETGRSRIQEFIDGRGQGGTVVEVDAPDAKISNDPNARAEADKRLADEREVAKRTITAFPQPEAAKRSTKQWGGLTPLQFAVREGSMDTVKTLVDAGADV